MIGSARSIIAAILPEGAVCAEAFQHVGDMELFPEERVAIARAVEKRRREFSTGRLLARRALGELGIPAVPIPSGLHHEPVWPAGIVGSITHCDGYCAAVVARDRIIAAVGIDAERHSTLPDGVLRLVTRNEERAWIQSRTSDAIHWDRVVFSAKESVFKAWFTLSRRWLDFEATRLEIDPSTSTFYAHLVSERANVDGRVLTGFTGQFLVHEAHVLTAVAVLRSEPGFSR